ncbi:uncharacterized protein LOC144432843 [Glandiceps talaboti]
MPLIYTFIALSVLITLGESYGGPAMYGVCDGKLFQRDSTVGKWAKSTPISCCVTSVKVLPDGSFIGVGIDEQLYTKKNANSDWTGPIDDSCCIQDVTVMADGTILGISKKMKIMTRAGIDGKWVKVKQSKGAKRIDVFPDGRILGLSKSGKLKTRDGVTGKWKAYKTKGEKMIDISIQPDGSVFGVGKSTKGLHVLNMNTGTDKDEWSDVLENTHNDCVQTITSPGNLKFPTTTLLPPVDPTTLPSPTPTKGIRLCKQKW